ncbi:MAG: M28 family metallopeptidase [Caulobacteraceae bacterium]
MRRLLVLAALALPSVAGAQVEAPARLVRQTTGAVSEGELRATITHLVTFGTRHTLSDTTAPDHGIGAARRWATERFEAISRGCGGCLQIDTPQETFTGNRLPASGVIVQDVLAIQRGTTDPGRVIVISGHIDSRVNDVMDATSVAPGADDDGSGVAAVLEAARVLSHHKFPATLVFAINSGEEQGLYGARVLANYAVAHGWRVEAALNNDIIGNTNGQNGAHVDGYVRVFSEGDKSVQTPQEAARRRTTGGEDDSPSRELARYIEGVAVQATPNFKARMIFRTDRYGRSGDQVPMLDKGFPAVRFTEAAENWDRQHQNVRTENGRAYGDVLSGVDFGYLAQVTRINIATMALLASAPPAPEGVKADGALKDDTAVSWKAAPGAVGYHVWWRDSTAPRWEHVQDAGDATTTTLKDVLLDDWLVGVASVSAEGFTSPVEYPGPTGAFVNPPPAK